MPRDRPDCPDPDRAAHGRLRRRRAGGARGVGCAGARIRRLAPLALAAALSGPAAANELGVNLYGLSYHFERERAKELGFDNEFNPGLGLRYRIPREKFDWFLDGGAYHDSGRNTAVYAGGGAFWKVTQGLRLGGALAFFHSDTYNDGAAFIAPVPLVAYEWRALTLNAVYFPKISGVNEINTLGFWITVWPKGF